MAARTRVKERQTEFWTSRAIDRFFEDEGYEVTVWPLSAVTENELPLDFIFWDPKFSKLFGIQYKALYGNGEEHWPIDRDQLEALREIPWAAYSLSEIDDARLWRNALHRQALVFPKALDRALGGADRLNRSALSNVRYARWAGVVSLLESCRFGHRVEDADDLRAELQRLVGEPNRELLQMVDVFIADKEARKLLHLDPLQKPSPVDPKPDRPKPRPPRIGQSQLDDTPFPRRTRPKTRRD